MIHNTIFDAFVLFIYFYFFIIIIIFLLYNIVLVLPYINMHPPQVYTCSPSWTPLPPPSPYFWIVVLEKTLESPLDCKKIKPINPKGNQPWIFTGRTDAKVDAPILWLPDANSRLIERQLRMGKIEGRRGVGDTGLDGWMGPLEQTLVDSEGQGSLVCCSSWGCRVGHNSATKQQYQSIECINPLKCFLKAQPPYN